MTVAGPRFQPLISNAAIVKPDGTPTDYFIKWAQNRQLDIGDSITLGDLIDILSKIQIDAGTALSGGGALAPDTTNTINLENTAVVPGSYTNTNLTVDPQGRITAASNGSGGGGGLTPPVAGDFPTTLGSPTISYATNSLLINNVANGSGISGVGKTTSGAVTLTAKLTTQGLSDFNSGFIFMSNGTRFLTVGSTFGYAARTARWNTRTSFNSEPFVIGLDLVQWFRMVYDPGTGNVQCQYSASGDNWVNIGTADSWLSAGVVQVGFGINRNNVSISPNCWIESFQIS